MSRRGKTKKRFEPGHRHQNRYANASQTEKSRVKEKDVGRKSIDWAAKELASALMERRREGERGKNR